MPVRTLTRAAVFTVEDIYTNYLSAAPGWSGGSADDIRLIAWDSNARTVSFHRKIEGGPTVFQSRVLTITALELFTALSGIPAWGGGTAADIASVSFDAAGRKMRVVKVSEAA